MEKQANRTIWRRIVNLTIIALFLSSQCGLADDIAIRRIIGGFSSLIITPCYAEFDVSPSSYDRGGDGFNSAFTLRQISPSPKINVSVRKTSASTAEFTKNLANRLVTPSTVQPTTNRADGAKASNPANTHALSVKACIDKNPTQNNQKTHHQEAATRIKPEQSRSINTPNPASMELNHKNKKNLVEARQMDVNKDKNQSTVHLTLEIKNKMAYSSNSLTGKENHAFSPRDTVDTVSPQKFEVKSLQDTAKHQKKIQNSPYGVMPIFKNMIIEQLPLMLATSDTGLRLPISQEALPEADPFDLPLDANKSRTEDIYKQFHHFDIGGSPDNNFENSQSLLNNIDLIALTAVNYAKTGLSPPGNNFSSVSRVQTSHKDNRLDSSSYLSNSTDFAPDTSSNNSTNHIITSDNSFDAGLNRRYDGALFPYPPRAQSIARLPASFPSMGTNNLTGDVAVPYPTPQGQPIVRL
ncbi:MAG TPA: hypothetical protein P5110_00990 [Candidatus Omnitrophota bacterium]|nr:hypothetical protein [Candidatus Omnitrophota bacterium]